MLTAYEKESRGASLKKNGVKKNGVKKNGWA